MKASAAVASRMILAVLLARGATALGEDEPLHTLIDQRLKPVAGVQPERSSDAEFLRRVSLDLVGMPPTSDEARAFIADPAADKRERLIDRLFASPQHARHLAATLDVMLMERRANTHITADEWQAWLLKSVRDNKPWNVLAREILEADGENPEQRPAARFALDRASEAHVVTRDVGRIFFGRDMQCAQCHDHPIVANYLQSDYHGLLAFIAPTYALLHKQGDKQVTLNAEKAGSALKFESVFLHTPRRTGARMPDDVAVDEPFFLPGDEYTVAPAENVKSVPKFSRRAKLAELATNGSNQAFNQNIANRLWAHMFGRGLVHPLDLHHPENPATEPELLRLLSERLARMNFNIRVFLRELALSEAYQRSFEVPAWIPSMSEMAATEVTTSLQQQRAALKDASAASDEAYSDAAEVWGKAEAATLPVADELEGARTKFAEAKLKFDEAVKAAADATTQLQAKQKVAEPVAEAATAAQQAAQALADDKELADAAQKFVSRSQQLTAEVAVLTKTAAEKTAVVKPATDAWNGVKPTMDAALTKVTPLTTTEKEAERAMLKARCQAAADAEALAAIDRRLTTARGIAQLAGLHQAIAEGGKAVPLRESELAAAEQQLSDHEPAIVEGNASVKVATDAVTAAKSAMDAVVAEHGKRVEADQAIAAAVTTADAARQRLPDDAVLAEAVAKLQERLSFVRTESGESQRQVDAAAAAMTAATGALAAVQKSLEDAIAERVRRAQAVEAANGSLAAARTEVAARQSEFDTAVSEVADKWTSDFTVASLKPLTPEQLCWTVFRVTGVYERYWQVEVVELNKIKPLTQDPAQLAARNIELEQRTYDKLKGNLGTFVAYYGAAAGQPQSDFFATADQALFAANGGAINSWVAPASDNVTERIVKQEDLRKAAEELYLSVLTRMPTEEETTEVVTYISSRSSDKPAAAQELVWGLLNSAEFRFNH